MPHTFAAGRRRNEHAMQTSQDNPVTAVAAAITTVASRITDDLTIEETATLANSVRNLGEAWAAVAR